MTQSNAIEATYDRLSAEFFETYYTYHPVHATRQGLHQYDNSLGHYKRAEIEETLRRMKAIQQQVTGRMPVVLPITMQDITPYGNELFHINSVLQPCVATRAPVVGVALTAEVAVPGSATGASHPGDIELAVRFCLEVAKAFGRGTCSFYDPEEWTRIQRRYGPMTRLQTLGND
jgi:hypothetical protein